MKAMIFYTVMPPEYEKKMEHMVGEQLLRVGSERRVWDTLRI